MENREMSRACPFCGAPRIIRKNGEYVCAYCLQPLDISDGMLSDGFNKLASYNFAGAAAFFRDALDFGGAEAYYGLFLARNKIVENRVKGTINPEVFAYRPEPFDTDPDYAALMRLGESERGVIKKLEKIEAARAATMKSKTPCDAVIYYDDGTEEESRAFAEALHEKGFETLLTCDYASVDTAVLRNAGGAYAFVSGIDTVLRLVSAKAIRRYALTDNLYTETTGLKKKSMKIISAPLPSAIAESVRELAEICPDADPAAEARRLRYALPAERRFKAENASAPPTVALKAFAKFRTFEKADYGYIKRSLEAGDYDDALAKAEKLRRGGTASPELYWYAYLARSEVRSSEEFAEKADERAFAPAALAECDGALSRCADSIEAIPYITLLVDAALRLIDKHKINLVTRALDMAFTYEYSDFAVGAVLARLEAVKDDLTEAEYFAPYKSVMSKLHPESRERTNYALTAADFAMSRGDFGRADDVIESALEYFPACPELWERKLVCRNRVKTADEVFAREYPHLGEEFERYFGLVGKEQRASLLRRALTAALGGADNNGFDKYADAVYELCAYSVREGNIFGADDYVQIGEAALRSGEFEEATAYFARAVNLRPGDHLAYWGALKAEKKCRDDLELEECDGELGGGFYAKAYDCAVASDENFAAYMEDLRRRRLGIEKVAGHVYRREDFVMRDDTVVRYVGRGERVYVGGSVRKIGANAFRGAAVKSVILGDRVTTADSYAFAFSRVESVTLSRSLMNMGVNPFCGCERLRELKTFGKFSVYCGGLYFGDKLVSFIPSLDSKVGEDGVAAVRSGTRTVCAKAFWYPRGVRRIEIPSGAAGEPCALYGCDGVRVSGSLSAQTAFAGEGVYGDCVLDKGVLRRDGERWESVYGDCTRNAAVDSPVDTEFSRIAGSGGKFEKVVDTDGKIDGGLLVKNDRVIFTRGASLYVRPLMGSGGGTVRLEYPASGTGVLWNEYIVVPTEKDGGTLAYIDERGQTAYEVSLERTVTRPLCLAGDVLFCVCGNEVKSVNLRSGEVKSTYVGERITGVPCSDGKNFAVASNDRLYIYDGALAGGAVHSFGGVPYTEGSGKVLRGRVTYYAGAYYWVERSASALYMGAYDGKRTTMINIPRAVADYVHTQPIFAGGNAYFGASAAVISAHTQPIADSSSGGEEWLFKVYARTEKYTDIVAVGGSPKPVLARAGGGNLRFRAVYRGCVLACDAEKGGIYAARL